jgi:hypothetical protein
MARTRIWAARGNWPLPVASDRLVLGFTTGFAGIAAFGFAAIDVIQVAIIGLGAHTFVTVFIFYIAAIDAIAVTVFGLYALILIFVFNLTAIDFRRCAGG